MTTETTADETLPPSDETKSKPRKRAAKKAASTPRGPRARERSDEEQAEIDTTRIVQPPATSLSETIRRVMAEMPAVGKSNTMKDPGSGSYAYRSIEDLLPHFTRLCAFHGLTIKPAEVVHWMTEQVGTTKNGNPKMLTQLKVRWKLTGPLGDEDADCMEIVSEAIDFSDKGTAKAFTQSRKLLIECLTFVPTQESNDPDHYYVERGTDSAEIVERGWDRDRLQYARDLLAQVTDEQARTAIVHKLADAASLEDVETLQDFPGPLDEWVCNGVEHWVERWHAKQDHDEVSKDAASTDAEAYQ